MLRRLSSSLLLSQHLGTVRPCQEISRSLGTGSAETSPPAEVKQDCGSADKASSTNEFLKSFGILLEEPKQAKVVGRWDWHLWQLCAALLPALGVFGLVQFARADMRKEEAILHQKKQEKVEEDQALDVAQAAELQTANKAHTEDPHKQLQAKVLGLEQALQRLQMQQLMQQAITPGVKMDILQELPALHADLLQPNMSDSSSQHDTAANTSQQGSNPGDDKHHCAEPGQSAAIGQHNSPNTVSMLRRYLQHYRQQAMSNLTAVFAKQESDMKGKQTPDT